MARQQMNRIEDLHDDESTSQVFEETTALASITRGELDAMCAFALRQPRSIQRFTRTLFSVACASESVAQACIYSIPRAGKRIIGPSVRFAEIMLPAYRNCRAATRIMSVGERTLTAQAMFFDAESNVGVSREIERRITDKNGRRFNDDMITVTSNAACSIALRDVVFHGIPRALWDDVWLEVQTRARGEAKSVDSMRTDVLTTLHQQGVDDERIYAAIGIEGIADIGADEILDLRGLANQISSGEVLIENAFPPVELKPGRHTSRRTARTAASKADEPAADAATPAEPSTPQADAETPTEDGAARIGEALSANVDHPAIAAPDEAASSASKNGKPLTRKRQTKSKQPDMHDTVVNRVMNARSCTAQEAQEALDKFCGEPFYKSKPTTVQSVWATLLKGEFPDG